MIIAHRFIGGAIVLLYFSPVETFEHKIGWGLTLTRFSFPIGTSLYRDVLDLGKVNYLGRRVWAGWRFDRYLRDRGLS